MGKGLLPPGDGQAGGEKGSVCPEGVAIKEIPGLKFRNLDHVILFSKGDPEKVMKMLQSPSFPSGVEVITGDMSLVGWKGRIGYLYDTHLDELRKGIVLAHKGGNLREAQRLQEKYRNGVKETRDLLKRFYLKHKASSGIPPEILEVSRKRHLTLWVGGPRYDEAHDALYNSYFCIKDGKISGFHDKKYLWGYERDFLSVPKKFNGDFGDKMALICWEAEALNPHYQKPSPLGEAKKQVAGRSLKTPLLLYIAGFWPTDGGVGLRGQASKAVRRGVGEDRGVALRPEGALGFVNNDGAEAYLIGPATGDHSSRKSEVYASISEPGLIRVTSTPEGKLAISCLDDSFHPLSLKAPGAGASPEDRR